MMRATNKAFPCARCLLPAVGMVAAMIGVMVAAWMLGFAAL